MNNKKFCTNCNSTTHEYNSCREPRTSWGIILINSENKFNLKHKKIKIDNSSNITITTEKGMIKYSTYIHDIKFLLISRKHSLTYIEFVRGRYKEDNHLGVKGLFELMMQYEIDFIKYNDFDTIWNDFWNNHEHKLKLKNEYYDSKNKFNKLKYKNNIKYNLEYYTTVKPHYTIAEWGIPKGRKKYGESDLNCALREFTEETQIDSKDIKIINEIYPLIELMQGTDGKQYRHIYFVAELINNISEFKINNNEVQNIGFFSYFDSIRLLRPYHKEKKIILENVLKYYMNMLINSD